MIRKTACLLFLALLLAMTGCNSIDGLSKQPGENLPSTVSSHPNKTIAFPRQKKTNGEWVAMDALIRGSLVLADNCIRLQNSEVDMDYMLIWPPDFGISIENGMVIILNGEGKSRRLLGIESK